VNPEDLRYTPEHEWVKEAGETVRVGVTDFAQEALGDIVFVTLPDVGAEVSAGEPCGEVESTKSVSDIYSPVDGEVAEVNGDVDEDPGLVNSDPYGAGWLMRVRLDDGGAGPAGLLTADEYAELTKEQE
jgi:glycine cleavage system H protein